MKKLLGILVLGLLWCNVGLAKYDLDYGITNGPFADMTIYITKNRGAAHELWFNEGKCSIIPYIKVNITNNSSVASKRIYFTNDKASAHRVVCFID